MKLTVLDEVTSTNEVVKNALREGKAEGLIVRARRQLSGYGRQGREWDSPEGGLYMSILLRPDVAGSGLATLSLVVGLSVQRALGQVGAPQVEGGAVRIEDAAGTATLEGTATGVDERGRLLVRTADDTVPVASGEAHVMVMP